MIAKGIWTAKHLLVKAIYIDNEFKKSRQQIFYQCKKSMKLNTYGTTENREKKIKVFETCLIVMMGKKKSRLSGSAYNFVQR